MAKTTGEWLHDFEALNGRKPTIEEFIAAQSNGEFSAAASEPEAEAEVKTPQENSLSAVQTPQNPAGNTSALKQENPDNERASFGWFVLAFFIPIVGLILWLIWRNDMPKRSQYSRNGFFAGIALNVLAAIFIVIIGISFAAKSDHSPGINANHYNSPSSTFSSSSSTYDFTKDFNADWDAKTKTFTTDNGILKIGDIAKTTDYDAEPALKIYFTLTNKQAEPEMAIMLLLSLMDVQQKTVNTSNHLDSTKPYDYYDYDYNSIEEEDHLDDNINPDGTVSGFLTVKLENETDPIVIVLLEDYETVTSYEIPLN
ncbi:DUF5067 domain-containing protein [Lactovum odontotermitis]